MNMRIPIFLAVLALCAFAVGHASAQTASGGSATSDRCMLEGTTEPSIGIQTFHCQGGNCVVGRARSTTTPGGGGASQTTDGAANWAFTVEPTLWQIRADGPAAGRIQDGDVLVAVNGYPITTNNGGFQLTSMATGIPLKLQVRREQRLLVFDITPVQACWPITASAGPESVPRVVLQTRQGAGARGRGAGATGGAVGAGGGGGARGRGTAGAPGAAGGRG